jgi:hypothetical protein
MSSGEWVLAERARPLDRCGARSLYVLVSMETLKDASAADGGSTRAVWTARSTTPPVWAWGDCQDLTNATILARSRSHSFCLKMAARFTRAH